MESVPSTLHQCLNYLHKGTIHCIIGDYNIFSHCNSDFILDSPQMSRGHLLPITILVNNHLESSSSCSLEPLSLTLSPIPSISISQPPSSSPSNVHPIMCHDDKSPQDSTCASSSC